MPNADRIAAISTAPGRAGIGVIRVSGNDLRSFATDLLGLVPRPREATLRPFLDTSGEPIDQGIALYFPAPHSFTGEDVLELQGHGGDIVLRLVLQRCISLGARLAQPGEFTRRAYLNDKLDLAQAESVADLIDAASAQAAKSAFRSLAGEFSRRVKSLLAALVELRTLIEGAIDFPEEGVDFLAQANGMNRLATIESALARIEATAEQGSLLRTGLQVVLMGKPNVGKSSLLNCLAGEDLAIVTPVPGTTRDSVRGEIQVEGVPIHIVDTAGLRPTSDEIEQIGIHRAWEAAAKADLALVLLDATQGEAEEDRVIFAQLPLGVRRLRVWNKIDLREMTPRESRSGDVEEIYLSAKTGAGIDLLRKNLLKVAGWHAIGEDVFIARTRHLIALGEAKAHLREAREQKDRLELFAEELRLAHLSLTAITGEFTADDLLGEIFSRFCIGK